MNNTFDFSASTTVNAPSDQKYLSYFGIKKGDVDVKPRLLETKLATRQDFLKISDGFKSVFGNDDKEDFKIPIVGYTGHRKGEKSENLIGNNFRNTSMQTKKIERRAAMARSFYVPRH